MEPLNLHFFDYLMLLVVSVLLPVRGYFETGKLKDSLVAGNRTALSASYRETIATLWIVTAGVFLIWYWQGRSLESLGLVAEMTFEFIAGCAGVALLSLLLFFQVYQAKTNPKAAWSLLQQLDSEPAVLGIMPATAGEYCLYKIVSVTAGITEEIIYRGYFIWLFGLWFSPWLAAGLSLLVFVAGHLYQRSIRSLLRVAGVGAVLTLAYVLSGSLLPAIVLHIAVDITSGATIWHARRATGLAQNS